MRKWPILAHEPLFNARRFTGDSALNSGRKACRFSVISTSVPKASKHTALIPSKMGSRSVREAGVTIYVPINLAVILLLDLMILLLVARILDLQPLARLVQHVLQALVAQISAS